MLAGREDSREQGVNSGRHFKTPSSSSSSSKRAQRLAQWRRYSAVARAVVVTVVVLVRITWLLLPARAPAGAGRGARGGQGLRPRRAFGSRGCIWPSRCGGGRAAAASAPGTWGGGVWVGGRWGGGSQRLSPSWSTAGHSVHLHPAVRRHHKVKARSKPGQPRSTPPRCEGVHLHPAVRGHHKVKARSNPGQPHTSRQTRASPRLCPWPPRNPPLARR